MEATSLFSAGDILQILTAIVLGCYFVYRVIRIFFVGKSREKLAEKVAQNPALAAEIADELYYMYGKLPIQQEDLFEDLLHLKGRQLERYHILGVQKLNQDRYLFITRCNDINYDENYRKQQKRDEVYFYNFVLARNVERDQYEVYSGKYNNLSDKNLMTRFSTVLFKCLDKQKADPELKPKYF